MSLVAVCRLEFQLYATLHFSLCVYTFNCFDLWNVLHSFRACCMLISIKQEARPLSRLSLERVCDKNLLAAARSRAALVFYMYRKLSAILQLNLSCIKQLSQILSHWKRAGAVARGRVGTLDDKVFGWFSGLWQKLPLRLLICILIPACGPFCSQPRTCGSHNNSDWLKWHLWAYATTYIIIITEIFS